MKPPMRSIRWRASKVMGNVALQKILVNKAMAFGVTIDVSLLIMNLKANMEYTQSHEWGRKFRVSGQAIRKKFTNSHKHDQTLYDDMIQEYAAADCVRLLREAPAPSEEQANLFGAVSGELMALQHAFDDYEESAYSVDEDSGKSTKKKSKKKKRTPRANAAMVVTARARGANRSRLAAASPPTAARKANANTARNLAHPRGSMKQTNASTTRSTKVGDPAKYARS